MSEELEKIDNVKEVETIPTDNTTEELQENAEETTEVIEVPEDNSAEIETEQERLRQEHEEYLNSFPDTTVFYRDLLVNGNVKSLGTVVRDPHVAEQWGFLDNHFDESELTYIGTKECGTYYLKGYEKPDKTEAELIAEKANQIDKELEALLDATEHQRNYKNVESCVSYFNSTDDKYRAEAIAVNRWRDDLYRTAQTVLDDVKAGRVDWHDVDVNYIVSKVDPLIW